MLLPFESLSFKLKGQLVVYFGGSIFALYVLFSLFFEDVELFGLVLQFFLKVEFSLVVYHFVSFVSPLQILQNFFLCDGLLQQTFLLLEATSQIFGFGFSLTDLIFVLLFEDAVFADLFLNKRGETFWPSIFFSSLTLCFLI